MMDNDNARKINTRKDLVADAIRDKILLGSFKPGDKLDQVLLAEELDVSRSPIREALQALDTEGLITSIPNRGQIIEEGPAQELLQTAHFKEAYLGV